MDIIFFFPLLSSEIDEVVEVAVVDVDVDEAVVDVATDEAFVTDAKGDANCVLVTETVFSLGA